MKAICWSVLAALAPLSASVHAQGPDQFLRGLAERARQVQAAGTTSAPTGQATLADPGPGIWPTRRDFLAAAEAGRLMGLSHLSLDDQRKVVASIQHIFQTEYRVPPITRECYEHGGFPSAITGLLSDITEVHAIGLSNDPPDFTNPQANREDYMQSIHRQVENLKNPQNRTYCDSEVMGRVAPHPYKAALLKLAKDYSDATKSFVIRERARRQQAYQEAQVQQRQQQEQQQAEVRAAGQRRIDAEAARVRADEERRAAKEKARVGG